MKVIVKKSQAEEIFTDMMDSEISKEIAYRSKKWYQRYVV